MLWITLTLIAGFAGGLLFLRLRFPAGAMVGAMVVTALLSIITGEAYMPANMRVLTQLTAGALIGSAVQYQDLIALKKIVLPALLMIAMMISLALGMGFILYNVTDLDLPTALMATAPGGVMDISLISADVGANSSKVAILQLLRLMTVMSFFPIMLRRISLKTGRIQSPESSRLEVSEKERNKIREHWYLSRRRRENVGLTLGIALLAGLSGFYLGVPAGALTFAMIATAGFNILSGRGWVPPLLRRVIQVLAGILIGVRVTASDIRSLQGIILPALLLILGLIVINLVVGYLLDRFTGIGLITALIASVPGGATDMALIAGELGGDQSKVAVIQLFRYVFVIAAYPVIIRNLLALIQG